MGVGVGLFQLAGIFFHVHCLCRMFFSGVKSHRGGGGYSTVAILIFTRHNLIAWYRLQTIIVLSLTQSFCFTVKVILRRKHNQVLDTVMSGYSAQLMGLRCMFCLMSREIIILFIPFLFNKIHSWHNVNQGFS